MRIGEHLLNDPVTAIGLGIRQTVQRAVALRVLNPMLQITLLLVAKSLAIGDEKLKIPRVRLIYARVVNLVDDAVAQCEPDPATGMIGRAQALLGAGCPVWLNAGPAESYCAMRFVHSRLGQEACESVILSSTKLVSSCPGCSAQRVRACANWQPVVPQIEVRFAGCGATHADGTPRAGDVLSGRSSLCERQS